MCHLQARLPMHARMRYPILLVHGPALAGKGERVVSLFKTPLYLEIGAEGRWPAGTKKLWRNLEKVPGKCHGPVELLNAPSGEVASTLDLFRLPMVSTINDSTSNLDFAKDTRLLQQERTCLS